MRRNALVDRFPDPLFVFKGKRRGNRAHVKVQVSVPEVPEDRRIHPRKALLQCRERLFHKIRNLTDLKTHVVMEVSADVGVCARNGLADCPEALAFLFGLRKKRVHRNAVFKGFSSTLSRGWPSGSRL